MTEQDIVAIIGKDRVLAGHPVVCPNVNHLLRGQQDMISVNGRGMLIEYEVKISRSDFKRDAKKGKQHSFIDHRNDPHILQRIPNQFFYVVPEDMVSVDELPSFAGLYYISNGEMVLKKQAPLLHKQKHDMNRVLKKVTTLYQQRNFLGCCLLTYQNKGIRERNKARLQQYEQQRTQNTEALLNFKKTKAQ